MYEIFKIYFILLDRGYY